MSDSFRDFALFVAAYEERSFTAAAQREHSTQPGVSQHIRKMEDRYGVRLFTRASGAVIPTPAGDDLYRQAIAILRARDVADRSMRGFDRSMEGEVRVGLMPTMTRCALVPALDRFMAAHPNVTLRITEAYSPSLAPMVRAGDLDFAIVPRFAPTAGLRGKPFLRTPEVLVSAADSGLQHRAPLRLASLGRLRLVLPSPRNTRRLTLDGYLTDHNVAIERLVELDAMLATLDLVERAGWMTILPGLMMGSDGTPRRFTVNPLADPPLWLTLVQIEPARLPLSAPAAAFLDVLRDEAVLQNAVWGQAPKAL